jgi:hypothetical protein
MPSLIDLFSPIAKKKAVSVALEQDLSRSAKEVRWNELPVLVSQKKIRRGGMKWRSQGS